MKRLFIFLFLFIVVKGSSQNLSNRFFLDVGLTARTPVFYFKGLDGQSHGPLLKGDAPYSYKQGVVGTGLVLGYGYVVSKKSGVKLSGTTTTRYDFHKFDKASQENVNTFYFDQSLFLTASVFSKFYIGGGVTFFSIGKELKYTSANQEKTLQLHFNSFDILFGIPVWKIYLEPKVAIVDDDFPGSVKDNATLICLQVYYPLPLSK